MRASQLCGCVGLLPARRCHLGWRCCGLPMPACPGAPVSSTGWAVAAANPAASTAPRPPIWRTWHRRRWRRNGRLSSRLLHDLQRRTALACCVCDPGGEAPFQRREHLLRHMQEAHDRRLCSLCLQVGLGSGWEGGGGGPGCPATCLEQAPGSAGSRAVCARWRALAVQLDQTACVPARLPRPCPRRRGASSRWSWSPSPPLRRCRRTPPRPTRTATSAAAPFTTATRCGSTCTRWGWWRQGSGMQCRCSGHRKAAHPGECGSCAFCALAAAQRVPVPASCQVHYSCHVCPPPVAAHAYFNRAPDLLSHMR